MTYLNHGRIGWLLCILALAGTISAQSPNTGKQLSLEAEIKQSLAAGELPALASKLDEWEKSSDEAQVILAGRQRLALEFLRRNDNPSALNQANSMLRYGKQMLDTKKDLLLACMSVIQAEPILRKTGDNAVADKEISAALELIAQVKANPLPSDITLVRSLLRRLQASQFKANNQPQEGYELLQSDLKEVQQLHQQDISNPERAAQVILALVASALTVEADKQEHIYEEIQRFGLGELQARPSLPILLAYMNATSNFINGVNSTNPEKALQLLSTVTQKVGELKAGDDKELEKALADSQKSLKNTAANIARASKLKSLLNTKAPELTAAHWINGQEISAKELQGKITLLSFWAVWHQPSLSALPQLNKLSDQYRNQVQFIGVTLPYGLKLDAASKKVIKAEGESSIDDEVAMLNAVSAQLKLTFPTMLLDKGSQVPAQLGVSNIPHLVLIDQAGVVQMILVGPAANNVEQIRQSIDKLLQTTPK